MNYENKYIYNWTSCLRDEYKCLEDLTISLNSLKTSLKVDIEFIKNTSENENENELNSQISLTIKNINLIENEILNFPKYPELPPKKPLIKVVGVIEEITIKKVIGYFDFSEYSTEKACAEERIKRDNEGASILLLLQFFGGDVPHARFNDGKRKESKCSYIEGKINGNTFSGWVRQTNVKVGDYVELAAMQEENNYYIYALATPRKGIISMLPNCYAGRRYPNIKQLATMYGKFYTIVFLIMCLFETPNIEQLLYAILVISSFTSATTYLVYRGMINENRAPGELFEEICNVLNIPNGKKLNLSEYTDMKINDMKNKGENIEPGVGEISGPQKAKQSDFNINYYPRKS